MVAEFQQSFIYNSRLGLLWSGSCGVLTHGPGLYRDKAQFCPLRSSLWPTVATDQTPWAPLRTKSCSTDTNCTENNKGHHASQHLSLWWLCQAGLSLPLCRQGHLSHRENQHSGNAHSLTLAPNPTAPNPKLFQTRPSRID